MNRIWKEALKRGMASILAFTIASLLVVSDTGIAFADLSGNGLLRDGLSLKGDSDISGSVVDSVTFENQENNGVLISVSSEDSDFRPGDDVTLYIYVKNESDQIVTGGKLSYDGDGIQKGTGDLILLGMVDRSDFLDRLRVEGNETQDGITLEPGEVFAAQFAYVVDKSVDERTAEGFQIDFRFEGIGEDGDVVEAEEAFSFTVNYLNVAAPEFKDSNWVKTGETVTMGIHANLTQADSVLTDSWEDASASDAEEAKEDEAVATPSQASPATAPKETIATASNASASATVSVATPSQAGAVKRATASDATATDSDADEVDSSADDELIDDRETALTPVDLSEVRYEIEMYNAKLHGFQVKKAMVDEAEDNMLVCTYRVAQGVEPGIYFGKVTQISETNGRTYESTQGFALIVEGEGDVTLEGSLGDTTVTVSGPADAFPDADDLEVRVTKLDDETQAKVEEAIRRRADEDGETIENYIAVDVSLYADGKEIQPGERVKVTIEYNEEDLTAGNLISDNITESEETESEEMSVTGKRVYHFNETEQEAEILESSREEEGRITVTTTGFSPMVVATVRSSGATGQGDIGGILDGDYAYLTDVEMVADDTTESGYSMRTGTSPWDADDEAGNDSGDINNVLRTYDIATYTVTFTSRVREDAPYKVYKEGTLYFEFLLEGTGSEVQYETLSMGWLSAKKDAQYVITEETMEKEDGSTATYQVLRGSYTWEPLDGNDHAIGESTQELTLAIRALALTNGAMIQPQFTFFLEGNEVGVDYSDWGTDSYADGILTGSQAVCPEHGETEQQTVTPPEVTVSAAASYNVKIVSASTSKCQSVGYFDFSTGNDLALNQGAGTVYGRMGAYGIVIQIIGKTGQGLRGVELPKSGADITFDLSLSSTFTYVDENGNTVVLSLEDDSLDSAYMPLIWSFDANLNGSSQQDGRTIPVSTRCADTVPLNELGTTGAYSYNSCYDGGNWSIGANEDGTYTVTISGCQIDMDHIPYTNQTGNSSSTTYYDPGSVEKYWEIDTACISAGEVWIVQPFYQYETDEDGNTTSTYIVDTYGDGTFTTYLQDTSLMMTTESGETLKQVTDNSNQAVTGDDKVGQAMAITKSGSISQNITYLKYDYSSYQDALTDGCYGTGQDWILMGDQLAIGGWLSHDSAEGGYTGVAYDVLVKFDDVFFEPEKVVASGVNGGTVTEMYAAKADQSGWDHQSLNPDEDGYDTEMKEADIDDLVYFDSMEELEGAGYTCVGVLLQYRGLVTEQMNHIHYYIKGSIKSDADVDYVYMVSHCARAWDREDLAEASGKSLSDLLSMSKSDVNDLVNQYIPTVISSGSRPDYLTDYPSSCYWINGGLDGDGTQSSRILAYTKPYYDESGYVSGTEGTLWGDSCLLVGYKTNVILSVAQTTTGDAEKISFDMDTNQRTVDYVVQGFIERNNGTFDTDTTQTTDVTVTVTLPAGLTYLEGSSYIGGTYTSNGEGVQGTVTGGIQLFDGIPVTYTDKDGNEIIVTLTVTENEDGTTTLAYQFNGFVIGSELTEYLEAIHLSCTIGTIGQEETDVQNNQSLVTTAVIESTEDRRVQSTANGNMMERGILISKNSAISLVKFADQSVVDVGESMGFTMYVGNNGTSDLQIVAVDALPYDGDGVSHVTGNVVVSEFSVMDENTADLTRLNFYYTLDEDKKGITSEEIEATEGYSESSYFTEENGWYELSLTEQDSFEPTAIAAVGTLSGGTTLRMHITIELPGAVSGDFITNTLTRDNLSSTAQSRVVDSSGGGTEEDPDSSGGDSEKDPTDADDSDNGSESESGSSGSGVDDSSGGSGSSSGGSGSSSGGSGSSSSSSGSSGSSSISSSGSGAGNSGDSGSADDGDTASPSDWGEDDLLSRLPKTGDHMPLAFLYLTTAVSGILVIALGTVSGRESRKEKKEKRE